MTVAEYAEILRDPALTSYEDGSYASHTTGRQGYRAIFRLGKKWYCYSVSNMAGVGIRAVQDLMGHKTINMTAPVRAPRAGAAVGSGRAPRGVRLEVAHENRKNRDHQAGSPEKWYRRRFLESVSLLLSRQVSEVVN
jgi:hypothetical protein